jgi:hypothetical protein
MPQRKSAVMTAQLKAFATNLYNARRAKEWSQSDLARKLWGEAEDNRGYKVARNRDLISSYEQGRALPSRENLENMAEVLGVKPEDLVPSELIAARMSGVGGGNMNAPMMSMTTLEGQPDKVFLQISCVTSLPVGAKIIDLLSAAGVIAAPLPNGANGG